MPGPKREWVLDSECVECDSVATVGCGMSLLKALLSPPMKKHRGSSVAHNVWLGAWLGVRLGALVTVPIEDALLNDGMLTIEERSGPRPIVRETETCELVGVE